MKESIEFNTQNSEIRKEGSSDELESVQTILDFTVIVIFILYF